VKKTNNPDFTSHREIAGRLGILPATVKRWARDGKFPAFALKAGTLCFYRSADWEHFVTTGAWPKGR
jgi:predicted site-specific integrase-resolvase